jgi:hypothetical protein
MIDAFFMKNKMRLQTSKKVANKKNYTDTRGGFTTVARRAKAQCIRQYMLCLYNNKKWMISTTISARKNRDYYGVTALQFDNTVPEMKKGNATIYYVVTPLSTSNDNVSINANNANDENHVSTYYNINYNELSYDIFKYQNDTKLEQVPPKELESLLNKHSTIKKKEINKLKNISDNVNIETNDTNTVQYDVTLSESKSSKDEDETDTEAENELCGSKNNTSETNNEVVIVSIHI